MLTSKRLVHSGSAPNYQGGGASTQQLGTPRSGAPKSSCWRARAQSTAPLARGPAVEGVQPWWRGLAP
eukprot:9550773-Alexandrium_andersonii.AAC.1